MRRALPLETLLRRPDLGVGVALALLVALAWLQLAWFEPAGGSMAAGHAAHAVPRTWGSADLGVTLLMWLTMSVAMMLPTAAPAILAFADITRGNDRSAATVRPVAAFVGGYLTVWAGFALLATAAQWALAVLALRLPGFRADATAFGGSLLVIAGVYQFSALKDRCLTQCRSPLAFFLTHWRAGLRGAFHLGQRHGLHCLGCCWALMALMLIGGAMSLAWTAALAAVMLVEKVAPGGRFIGRAVGAGLIGWGGILLAATLYTTA